MTDSTMLDRASNPPWTIRQLPTVLGSRGVCGLPGTGSAIVSTETGFVRVDAATGDVSPLSCAARDQFSEVICSRAVAGLDDHTFAVADTKTIRILEIRGDEAVEVATAPLENPTALAMALSIAATPDGKAVAVTATNVIQRVTRDGTSKSVSFDADFSNGVEKVAFSPDGKTLANGRGDGRVELRDVDTLEVRETLEGLGRSVLSLAYRADSQAIVAAGDGYEACRFDLASKATLALQPPGKLTGLAWFSDGSGYVATSLTRSVGVFAPDSEDPCRDMYPDLFDRNYFQDSVLVNDQHLVVLAEKAGVVVFDLHSGG